MTKIISFVNLKGGVGKTAISVNFASYCGSKGLPTLLVDMDPQTNASFSCIQLDDWKDHAKKKGTVANLMGMKRHSSPDGAKPTAKDVIINNVFNNVDLVPSHLDLFTIDLDLAGAVARESKLKRSLESVSDSYKIIICDCPPNLTIPTQNALAMSTHFAVPVSPDFLSALGVGILLSRVKDFCEDLQHDLKNVGIILSRVGRPAIHRGSITTNLRDRFGDLVLKTEIKERVAVSEAAANNVSIFETSDVKAAKEFRNASNELLAKMGI